MDIPATSGRLRTLAQKGASELYRRIHSHETERFEAVRDEFLCLVLFLYERRLRCRTIPPETDESLFEDLRDAFGRGFRDTYGRRKKAYDESLAGQDVTADDLPAILLLSVAGFIVYQLGQSSRPAVLHFLPPIVGDLAQRI